MEPRNVASPDINTEDVSAAVDCLGLQPATVDRDRIGVIGNCGWGGMVLNAVAADKLCLRRVASFHVRHDARHVKGLQR